MNSREASDEELKEQGWTEPLNSSPFELPEEWMHGHVHLVDDGRYWDREPGPQDYQREWKAQLEINGEKEIYIVGFNSTFGRVDLQLISKDSSVKERQIKWVNTDVRTEERCLEVAKDFIENAESYIKNHKRELKKE